jgi:hypothetical protein
MWEYYYYYHRYLPTYLPTYLQLMLGTSLLNIYLFILEKWGSMFSNLIFQNFNSWWISMQNNSFMSLGKVKQFGDPQFGQLI